MDIKSALASLVFSFSHPSECTSIQYWDMLNVICSTQEQIFALCDVMQTDPNTQNTCWLKDWIYQAVIYSPAWYGDSQ